MILYIRLLQPLPVVWIDEIDCAKGEFCKFQQSIIIVEYKSRM